MRKTLNPHAGSFVPGATGNPWDMQQHQQPPEHAAVVGGGPATVTTNLAASSSSAQVVLQRPATAATGPPMPAPHDAKASIHRSLLHARVAFVQRSPETPPQVLHMVFERLLHSTFRATHASGALSFTSEIARPFPFWKFFSTSQISAVAQSIAEAENHACSNGQAVPESDKRTAWPPNRPHGSTTTDSNRSTASAPFNGDELDILNGIYFRSVHAVFPAHVRKQLAHATATHATHVTEADVESATEYLLDAYWLLYRSAFLPTVEDCGLHGLSSCLQFLTQLRAHLLQTDAARAMLRMVLPLMTLSRYYGVLMRSASADGGPSALRVLFAQNFIAFISMLLLASPNDSIEATVERFSLEAMRELMPVFYTTASEHLSHFNAVVAMEQNVLRPLPPFGYALPQASVVEASLAASGLAAAAARASPSPATDGCGGSTSAQRVGASTGIIQGTMTDGMEDTAVPEPVLFPPPVPDSAFHAQVMAASSWCDDDNTVRFACLTLANTDMISLSRLSQLLTGLREAYGSSTGGTHEGLFDVFVRRALPPVLRGEATDTTTNGNTGTGASNDSSTPPGIQEVIECLMFHVKPGHPAHVRSLQEASRIVDQRMDEHIAATTALRGGGGDCSNNSGQRQQASQGASLNGRSTMQGNASLGGVAEGMTVGVLSPGRFEGSTCSSTSPQRGFSIDDTATLWQEDPSGDLSTGEDPRNKAAVFGTSVHSTSSTANATSAFKASGSIW